MPSATRLVPTGLKEGARDFSYFESKGRMSGVKSQNPVRIPPVMWQTSFQACKALSNIVLTYNRAMLTIELTGSQNVT